jgi:hypothetical protein
MTKNAKLVSFAAIGALILIVIIFLGRDVFLRIFHPTFDCGDGPRRTIDIRDFTTQYSAYAVELEATVADKGKISTKVNPVQLQQLSEAMQNAREFRKYVVAGYNSCAVTKAQYSQYGARFQALDILAREINELTGRPSLSQEERAKLAGLISQYGELTRKLGTE